MKKSNYLKQLVLLLGLMLPTAWCNANGCLVYEGYSDVQIKEAGVQGAPKGHAIQASVNGHYLTVAFKENLGQVAIEITYSSGAIIENVWLITPNGIQTYLPLAGDYVITFTLPNGDEYYGEFTITD